MILPVSAFLLTFAGCSFQGSNTQNQSSSNLVSHSGSLVIAKRLPPVTNLEQIPLYGFLPIQPISQRSEPSGLERVQQETAAPRWIEVNSSIGTITVKEGLRTVLSAPLDRSTGTEFKPESRKSQVITISKNPTWMAPDSYFLERGLPIPPEGDASRFLKGALGEIALFLDNGTVIHSGPEFSLGSKHTAPNGFRVAKSELVKLSELVQYGTKIVIR
ncbi:MAG: hypothetical protein KDD70_05580 [Bdellovibrionales bacterium]|nr:hypothetical protein [Bdellovibrionales bacterium]